MIYMGISSKTGRYSKCRAKDPSRCRFHVPGSHKKYTVEELTRLNEDLEAKAANSNDGHSLNKKTNAAHPSEEESADQYDAPVASNTERITTLLTDKVDLDDDRKGRFPTIDPNGEINRETRKLGKYLGRNFNGDFNQTNLDALKSAYGQEFHIMKAGKLAAADRVLKQAKAGSGDDGATLYESEDGLQTVIVSRGGRNAKSHKIGYYYRHTGIGVDCVKFDDVLSYQAIGERVTDNLDMSDHGKHELRKNILGSDCKEYDKRKSKGIDKYMYTRLSDRVDFSVKYYGPKSELKELPFKADDVDRNNGLTEEQYDQLKQWSSCLDGPSKLNGDTKAYANLYMKEIDSSHNDVHGAWSTAMADIADDEMNGEMNRNYARRANSGHSATIYEWKKNRDEDHDKAATSSSFSSDFAKVEVDDSVDLNKFNKIQNEWKSFRSNLPKTMDKPVLRFRKTGRHLAAGVYTPAYRNIAVDPRHPSSFTHEYYHHWDYDSLDGGHQRSMQPEFRDIVRKYKDTIDTSKIIGRPENYLAPTEVMARAGELYQHWKHPDQKPSFLKTDEEYNTRFDYQPLLPLKNKIMDFFDNQS